MTIFDVLEALFWLAVVGMGLASAYVLYEVTMFHFAVKRFKKVVRWKRG
jgi:hypothetical protein